MTTRRQLLSATGLFISSLCGCARFGGGSEGGEGGENGEGGQGGENSEDGGGEENGEEGGNEGEDG